MNLFDRSSFCRVQGIKKLFSQLSLQPVEKVEEKVPSLDEIEVWASPSNGFECLMSTPFGRRRFSEYLEREFR